jgi:hypothetical protein
LYFKTRSRPVKTRHRNTLTFLLPALLAACGATNSHGDPDRAPDIAATANREVKAVDRLGRAMPADQ